MPIRLILLLLILLVPGAVVAGFAGAQDTCQAVTPINEYANIRSSAGVGDPSAGSGAGNNITGRLNRGETACVEGLTGGWYHLTEGGYISAAVVKAVANVTRTENATPTRLPSLTPTPTNTPTPTAIPTLAVTPVLLRVCINYGNGGERVCSLFGELVSVTIERIP